MIVAGIDPGKEGAIVVLRDGSIVKHTLLKHCTPRVYLKENYVTHCFIEKAQVMDKDPNVKPSARAMFSYGREYGYLCGSLVDTGIEMYYIPPQEWTGVMHKMSPLVAGTPKESSLYVARKIWPTADWLATPASRKPHDGIVDAALIGVYGWKKYLKK
jgi:hypothetical protein